MRMDTAVLQSPGVLGDVDANVAELRDVAMAQASLGVRLLITPELYLTGYHVGPGIRDLVDVGIDERVRDIARDARISLVVGAAEYDDVSRRRLFNSAFVVAANGEVVARHRKAQLFGDLDRAYYISGDRGVTIAEVEGLRIGVLICYDVEFPEPVRAAALAGAQLIAVPTAQMEPFAFVADHVVPVRAWENQIYVAYANHCGTETSAAGDGMTYVGRSSIAAPSGEVLAAAGLGPAVLRATVDTDVVARAQQENPYLTDLRADLHGTPDPSR